MKVVIVVGYEPGISQHLPTSNTEGIRGSAGQSRRLQHSERIPPGVASPGSETAGGRKARSAAPGRAELWRARRNHARVLGEQASAAYRTTFEQNRHSMSFGYVVRPRADRD